ncbi:MAG: hypothetical protein QXG86_00510 [Candidatus Woesearchaeota archaeon]
MIRKNIIKRFLISGLVPLLTIPLVYALEPIKFLADILENNLSWLFIDLTTRAPNYFWLRVMLWIVLFATYYAVLIGVVPNFRERKNISITVAIVMALISVIFIPNGIIISIGKSYGLAVTFLLMGLPIVGAVYLMHISFPTGKKDNKGVPIIPAKRKFNHAIRAVLYYLIFTLLGNFINAMVKDPIFSTASAESASFGAFIEAITLIMMFYHLFAAIFTSSAPGEGEKGEEGWLLQKIKEGAKDAIMPPQEEKAKKEELKESVDLSNTRNTISVLNHEINLLDNIASTLNKSMKSYREAKIPEKEDYLAKIVAVCDDIRKTGEKIDMILFTLVSDPNFSKLQETDYIQIHYALRRYRVALELIISTLAYA